jgi:hypothetical protein
MAHLCAEDLSCHTFHHAIPNNAARGSEIDTTIRTELIECPESDFDRRVPTPRSAMIMSTMAEKANSKLKHFRKNCIGFGPLSRRPPFYTVNRIHAMRAIPAPRIAIFCIMGTAARRVNTS